MNFFERQDAARHKTSLLVVYFVICVTLIIASVYFVALSFYIYVSPKTTAANFSWWNPELFFAVMGITLIVVIVGSLYKVSVLSKGGDAVAGLLGGRLINPDTTDPGERRLLNVVEEMAIASGMSVPPVYLLEKENGINAFAAGFSPSNAVIAVTKGCIDLLNRDELQGVIAHEFSHIFNGDMRMNIRLMGVLHGILAIAIVGRILMRTRGRKNPLPLLGLGLLVIGYLGVLFGRMIKAAVSRQREFLGDACAVQFTRNPDGIGGALKKIGGLSSGSRITHSRAEEASHFYFANGLGKSLVGLMATHPPLIDRIKRIDPSFDGKFPEVVVRRERKAVKPTAAAAPGTKADKFAIRPEDVVSQVGNMNPKLLGFASAMMSALPSVLGDSIHQAFGARAVVYSVLLNHEPEIEAVQLKRLKECADTAVYQETLKIKKDVRGLPPEYHLSVIDMALPALRNLSYHQYESFRENVECLVQADKKVDLFEFMLEKILFRHLDPYFRKEKAPAVHYYALHQLKPECAGMLSVLAHLGNDTPQKVSHAFEQGRARLPLKGPTIELLPRKQANLDTLGSALEKLSLTAPKLKKNIMESCVACIGADGMVTTQEMELIRAVGDSLDCPVPPLLGR